MTVQLRHVKETKELIRRGVLSSLPSFPLLSDEYIRLEYNGCGPKGWEKYTPQAILGLHVCYACIIHDDEYRKGKTEGERNRADTRLKDNMLSLIEYNSKRGDSLRITIVYIVYVLLDLFGPILYYNKGS